MNRYPLSRKEIKALFGASLIDSVNRGLISEARAVSLFTYAEKPFALCALSPWINSRFIYPAGEAVAAEIQQTIREAAALEVPAHIYIDDRPSCCFTKTINF